MDDAVLVWSMSKERLLARQFGMQGFFGRLKNEMFHTRSWFGVSIEEFCALLDDYLSWYNEKQIKMSLGGRSPLEYRRSLGPAS